MTELRNDDGQVRATAVRADEDVLVVVQGDVEAEELGRDGVDVPVLLDRRLEHPQHREEHDHGEHGEQGDLDHGAQHPGRDGGRAGGESSCTGPAGTASSMVMAISPP